MSFIDTLKKPWVMVVFFAVVLVTAVVLVIYGVATHREAGFDDRLPRWMPADFPLEIHAETYTTDGARYHDITDEHTDVVSYVVDKLNSRLGFVAFVANGSCAPCDVYISLGVPYDAVEWTEPGGKAWFEPNADGRLTCQVQTANAPHVEALVLEHELGHCLGLAHDDFELSIMRPRQRPVPDGQLPPWITDHDRRLIRDAYLEDE